MKCQLGQAELHFPESFGSQCVGQVRCLHSSPMSWVHLTGLGPPSHGSCFSFFNSWDRCTFWRYDEGYQLILEGTHITRVRAVRPNMARVCILVGASLYSEIPVCPCSLSLLIYLPFGTACPKDFKLQHQMQRQWPYGDCLINHMPGTSSLIYIHLLVNLLP